MQLENLPAEITALLKSHNAPPRLIAHLQLVYNTACALTVQFQQAWPELVFDQVAVCSGAALHDIGKIQYSNELTGPGNAHEKAGELFLLEQGWPETYARFARTHGQWQIAPDTGLEDLLVALSDKLWKGQRDETLEEALTGIISKQTCAESWEVYLKLDTLANELSAGAHERIVWQGQSTIRIDRSL